MDNNTNQLSTNNLPIQNSQNNIAEIENSSGKESITKKIFIWSLITLFVCFICINVVAWITVKGTFLTLFEYKTKGYISNSEFELFSITPVKKETLSQLAGFEVLIPKTFPESMNHYSTLIPAKNAYSQQSKKIVEQTFSNDNNTVNISIIQKIPEPFDVQVYDIYSKKSYVEPVNINGYKGLLGADQSLGETIISWLDGTRTVKVSFSPLNHYSKEQMLAFAENLYK